MTSEVSVTDTDKQGPVGYKFLRWYGKEKKNLFSSSVNGQCWESGHATAYCIKHISHDAPEPDCQCGIYATYDIDVAGNYGKDSDGAIVVIRAMGRTIEHSNGFRTQQAQIIGIVQSPAVDHFFWDRGMAEAIKLSGFPVISFDDAEKLVGDNQTTSQSKKNYPDFDSIVSIAFGWFVFFGVFWPIQEAVFRHYEFQIGYLPYALMAWPIVLFVGGYLIRRKKVWFLLPGLFVFPFLSPTLIVLLAVGGIAICLYHIVSFCYKKLDYVFEHGNNP